MAERNGGGHNSGKSGKVDMNMMKKIFSFAYGLVAYTIFLGTFLYAIAFIGDLGAPTALDGPATGPVPTALLVDTGLLALFAMQHSIMARKWFKEWWTKIVPRPIERSTYVLFSSLALVLLFLEWRPIGGDIWSLHDSNAGFVLRGLFAFGWFLVLAATFLINHFDLFGLRQVWLYLTGRPYTTLRFRTPGPYRLVRHPLYVGWLFVFWMTPTMTVAHLFFAVATTAYILMAIRWEESDLVKEHGRAYEDYRRSVPMLVPVLAPARTAAGIASRTKEA